MEYETTLLAIRSSYFYFPQNMSDGYMSRQRDTYRYFCSRMKKQHLNLEVGQHLRLLSPYSCFKLVSRLKNSSFSPQLSDDYKYNPTYMLPRG